MKEDLPIIGSSQFVEVCGRKNVPAKIDTGADSSSIWASDIKVTEDGILEFKLFGKSSPFYSGKVLKRSDFGVALVRSSNGAEQIRFRTHINLKVMGKTIRVLFNLSDRSKNHFPILIGRRTLSGKFLVDVSKKETKKVKKVTSVNLRKELEENPYKFYQKYGKLTQKGGK